MWLYNANSIKNWFRLQCNLSDADYILVWTLQEEEIVDPFPNPIVKMLRIFKSKILDRFQSNGHSSTVLVYTSSTKSLGLTANVSRRPSAQSMNSPLVDNDV